MLFGMLSMCGAGMLSGVLAWQIASRLPRSQRKSLSLRSRQQPETVAAHPFVLFRSGLCGSVLFGIMIAFWFGK